MIGQTVGRTGDRPNERDRQRDATRQRIRAIALEAIGRDGLDGVRMGDIAQLAGVSRGTVYFHYASMEDLAAEVLAEAEARIGQAVVGLPPETPIERTLQMFCEAFAREWEPRPGLFRAVAAVSLRNAAARIQMRQVDTAHRVLSARFRVASEREELREAHGSRLAYVFLVHVLSATLAWTDRPKTRLGLSLADAVDIFLFGVLRRGRLARRAGAASSR